MVAYVTKDASVLLTTLLPDKFFSDLFCHMRKGVHLEYYLIISKGYILQCQRVVFSVSMARYLLSVGDEFHCFDP